MRDRPGPQNLKARQGVFLRHAHINLRNRGRLSFCACCGHGTFQQEATYTNTLYINASPMKGNVSLANDLRTVTGDHKELVCAISPCQGKITDDFQTRTHT
eukprot:1606007-Amphidinium_carterae.1